MNNVIELFSRRPAEQVTHSGARGTRCPTCPSWCIAEGEHEFHHGALRANLEHDENNEVVFALGGRVQAMFAGQRPMVEVVVWEAEEGVVLTSGRHLLTPAEAREVAGHLLRLAAEAEGVAS